MLKILDRYLVREVALPFAIALVVFSFVLMIPPILTRAEDLIATGVRWSTIAHALMLLLPQALTVTIPIAVLLGVLIGLGRVSADREFVAMQACGVSLSRLMRPIGVISLVASMATLYVTVVALPDANQTFREIVTAVVAERVEQNVRSGVFFEEFPHRTIFVRDVRPEGGWRDVLLADTQHPNRTELYMARRGSIRVDRTIELVQLELEDVSAYTTFADTPEKLERKSHDKLNIRLDPDTVFLDPPPRGPAEMTLAALREQILFAEQGGDYRSARPNRFMFQQKLALPATCPILALIALALGASNRKDGKFAGFVVGFAVILVYYVLLYGARALAMGGSISPDWAPWIPNIIMGLLAVGLTAWRMRAADQPLRFSLPAFWRPSDATSTAAPAASSPSAPPLATRSRIVVVVRVPRFDIPMPRLLDIYVTREYLRVALLGVASLLGIFYISTFIDIADELFRGEATTGMLMQYFFFQTPQFVYYVTPMALMVATLVTLGVLTKNSELLVMRACGISLYRTAAPILLFATLGSVFLFTLQERVLATANREADRLNRLIRGLPPATINRHWLLGHGGAVYHFDFFSPDANHFGKLQIYQVDQARWTLTAMTQVREARYSGLGGTETSARDWRARDGWLREFAPARPDGEVAPEKYLPFTERTIAIEPPAYFVKEEPLIKDMPLATQMTYGQLREHIRQLRASGAEVAPHVVALRRKISFPFVTIIITMLAVPFAVTTGRRGSMYGIGVGVVLAIVYWITLSVFGALGQGGVLSPTLAAWAPNILFGAAAAYMILTVRT